jgi:hypothetical protein
MHLTTLFGYDATQLLFTRPSIGSRWPFIKHPIITMLLDLHDTLSGGDSMPCSAPLLLHART